MSRILVFLAVVVLTGRDARAQNRAVLDSFYIVAHVISDATPSWFDYVLDVQQESGGALVRHIRIAPAGEFCPNEVTVRGVQKRTTDSAVALSHPINLCATNMREFERSISRVTSRAALDDTVAFTVVAKCGAEERVFEIPYLQTMDLNRLRRSSPSAASVVNLYGEVLQQVFPDEPINGEKHPKDYELQLAGESLVPILRSGRYDAGLDRERLTSTLERYRGPARYGKPRRR